MNESIYSSNNEQSFLKSVGPFKIQTVSPQKLPTVLTTSTTTVGEVHIYGEKVLLGKDWKKNY